MSRRQKSRCLWVKQGNKIQKIPSDGKCTEKVNCTDNLLVTEGKLVDNEQRIKDHILEFYGDLYLNLSCGDQHVESNPKRSSGRKRVAAETFTMEKVEEVIKLLLRREGTRPRWFQWNFCRSAGIQLKRIISRRQICKKFQFYFYCLDPRKEGGSRSERFQTN